MREDFRDQLEKFFDALEQAIDTGEPIWLDSTLDIWSSSQTQTDLENQQSSLTTFIKELLILTIQLCHESLEPNEAIKVISAIVPPFAYAFEQASHYEIEARVLYLTHRLAEVQSYMQSLDRAKSDFVAVAAHELRTPLTLVEGYAAMLQDTLLTPENRLQMLNGIQNGANRLRIIIDDMIDVSLIDNNLLKLNFQPTWLNRIFNGLHLELTPTLKERNQDLSIQSFPGSAELIYADPERIYQLFRNLITQFHQIHP